MKITLVTDAWYPQINGVVTSLAHTCRELEKLGHTVNVIGPDRFRTVPCPSYPEIRLALFPRRKLAKLLAAEEPDAVHIATEGPLGLAARSWCVKRGFPFTTAYHTRFPEYVWLRTRLPLELTYDFVRWFHSGAHATLVATEALKQELSARKFTNLAIWSRGVDIELFRPREKAVLDGARPIFMYVGRVAIEKNIEAFLKLVLPGTKYVVGDGPDLAMLKEKYPATVFTGFKQGEELAQLVASADVFVFPSRTDTFGLVVIEALACGVPVAAYPVPGPADIIEHGVTGCLSEDLQAAALDALKIDPLRCRAAATRYTWQASTYQFLLNLRPLTSNPAGAAKSAVG
jgi:glycosyltransferase involved in cell wall biosynthesis